MAKSLVLHPGRQCGAVGGGEVEGVDDVKFVNEEDELVDLHQKIKDTRKQCSEKIEKVNRNIVKTKKNVGKDKKKLSELVKRHAAELMEMTRRQNKEKMDILLAFIHSQFNYICPNFRCQCLLLPT